MAASEKSSIEVFSVSKVNAVCPVPTIATFLNFLFPPFKKDLSGTYQIDHYMATLDEIKKMFFSDNRLLTLPKNELSRLRQDFF
jgi:hypothetical protein